MKTNGDNTSLDYDEDFVVDDDYEEVASEDEAYELALKEEESAIPVTTDITIEPLKTSIVEIYTDGSCFGSPTNGCGGYATILLHNLDVTKSPPPPSITDATFEDTVLENGRHETTIKGFKDGTTANRMELQAAISGLSFLHQSLQQCSKKVVTNCKIYSDSQYVIHGIEWSKKWKVQGWRLGYKKDVKNKDLWIQLDDLIMKFPSNLLQWTWIPGHSGIFYNERADKIASTMAKNLHQSKTIKNLEFRSGGTKRKADTLPKTYLEMKKVVVAEPSRSEEDKEIERLEGKLKTLEKRLKIKELEDKVKQIENKI